MLLSLKHRYDSTAQLVDWLNPINAGDTPVDQYEYIFDELGPMACDFGIEPMSGRLTLYVPELLEVDNPMLYAPRNRLGQPLGPQTTVWLLQYPIPSLNAYKQITGWRYNLYERSR